MQFLEKLFRRKGRLLISFCIEIKLTFRLNFVYIHCFQFFFFFFFFFLIGQFLLCDNGMERLQVVLQIGANGVCDFDMISRNSIHSFFRAEESEWFHLKSKCLSKETNNSDDNTQRIAVSFLLNCFFLKSLNFLCYDPPSSESLVFDFFYLTPTHTLFTLGRIRRREPECHE